MRSQTLKIDRLNHRFFLAGVSAELNRSVDLTPLAHQLRNVLRMTPGSMITVLDDSGAAYATRIEVLDAQQATGLVLARERVVSEPVIELTLFQCVLKGERFEWVLQKCTELGVRRFVPVISSRTVVRPAAKLLPKYERWRAIVREAAEQSGRGRLPVLEDPLNWEEAVLDGAGLRLFPWEEARQSAMGLGDAFTSSAAISLLTGPEGGISQEEANAAIESGWQPVSLGPRILRAETAAVAATAIVFHLTGALG